MKGLKIHASKRQHVATEKDMVTVDCKQSLNFVGQESHLPYTSHGPAPLAPVVSASSRLIRPQGPHPRTAAWRACPRTSHAAGCCWKPTHIWTGRGNDRSASQLLKSVTQKMMRRRSGDDVDNFDLVFETVHPASWCQDPLLET